MFWEDFIRIAKEIYIYNEKYFLQMVLQSSFVTIQYVFYVECLLSMLGKQKPHHLLKML